MTNMLAVVIVVLVCLVIFALIFQQVYGQGAVRKVVCSALFWIPFGSIMSAMTNGCAMIPA